MEMKEGHESPAAPPTRERAPVARRPRARTALMFLLFAAFGGVALATTGEKYPDWGDAATETLVSAWKGEIKPLVPTLCTGSTSTTGSESTRETNEGTPLIPRWKPLGGTRADGASQYEAHEGEDTDAWGCDRYLYVKLVGTRANVFCKVVLETEDGKNADWKVRYRGEEGLAYRNGPNRRAEELSIDNPWAIGWSRRIVDYDAENGEYDEEKAITQDFAVRCDLIDGTGVGDGAKFARTVPATMSSTTSTGLKWKAGTKVGTSPGAEYGAELGLESSTTKTYDTKFQSLSDESGKLSGVATVSSVVPCPYANDWTVSTQFDGAFSIRDHENLNGDKGSRQELLLTVINYIGSIRVEKCHGCGTAFPPVPPDPPGSRTPADPSPPSQPGASTPPTCPVTTEDEPDAGAARGAVLTSPSGLEPGWGGVPPVSPYADPARGPVVGPERTSGN